MNGLKQAPFAIFSAAFKKNSFFILSNQIKHYLCNRKTKNAAIAQLVEQRIRNA